MTKFIYPLFNVLRFTFVALLFFIPGIVLANTEFKMNDCFVPPEFVTTSDQEQAINDAVKCKYYRFYDTCVFEDKNESLFICDLLKKEGYLGVVGLTIEHRDEKYDYLNLYPVFEQTK